MRRTLWNGSPCQKSSRRVQPPSARPLKVAPARPSTFRDSHSVGQLILVLAIAELPCTVAVRLVWACRCVRFVAILTLPELRTQRCALQAHNYNARRFASHSSSYCDKSNLRAAATDSTTSLGASQRSRIESICVSFDVRDSRRKSTNEATCQAAPPDTPRRRISYSTCGQTGVSGT